MDSSRRHRFIKSAHCFQAFQAMRIPLHAASTGYFLIVSLFPGLVLLLSLLRYTSLDADRLSNLVAGLLPEVLRPAARDFVLNADRHFSGSMVGLSAGAALWSAGRGIYGLMQGLNSVYGVEETRGWLLTRLICTAYTFAFLLILLLTLILQVFGATLWKRFGGVSGGLLTWLAEFTVGRYCLLMALQTALFCWMYQVLPNRHSKFRQNLPGALLSSAGWLLFSDLYSLYTRYFSGFQSVYGSVYIIAVGMLWLYCCLSIVFYGGALNRWLRKSGEISGKNSMFFRKID